LKRFSAIVAFILWTGIIISAYYVVQKPGLLNAFAGLADTLWTLTVAGLLTFNAYGFGARILQSVGLNSIDPVDRLLLGCGIGLGALGLLGLAFSAAQIARAPILLLFLVGATAFFGLRGDAQKLGADLRALAASWNLSFSQYSRFTKFAILLPFFFSFLLTLVPPFEAFDALSYHLAQPARILQDGGLQAVDIVPFWYPSLTENVYLWALALGSERAPQMLHFLWGFLAIVLLWRWAVKIWTVQIGRKTLLLLTTIVSLPMLASWAYVDLALAYYAAAALYTYTAGISTENPSWLRVTAVMAGLAMGVKYTSFVVPLTCGLLILFRRPFSRALSSAAQFSIIAILVALPWYVRNAILMGNPFYPFVFGGLYWDQFRADWYADSGTGIGWDVLQIFLVPLNIILGYREITPMDGRIGPVFLVLLPLTLWISISRSPQDSARRLSLRSINLFAALSLAAWTLGVINSAHLWQIRLFLPALLPFAIPSALAWDYLQKLDTPKLRISFLFNVLIIVIILLTIFANGIFVLQRNPLAVALGAQTREGYIARVNPSYAALIQLMDELPADVYVYSLFEPRSYGLPRRTQPDVIVYNFAHDFYLYATPSEIIQHWKAEGYTHIVVYERGLDFMIESPSGKFTPVAQATFGETLASLELISQTPDQVYTIYRIP
jgi:dolichyl-phosphate-mannose-protein mannosyltransferase